MDPGAYVEPLERTTWVQVPMVSGYVGSRLRIADYAFGTNVVTTAGTTVDDNRVRIIFENMANVPSNSTLPFKGTTIYLRINQATDDGPSGVRTSITSEYGVVPGGHLRVAFWVNQPLLEIKCTGGQGNIRAQITSLLKWEEMAYDKSDKFFAPQLWNQKFITAGVVAPSPFPTS